MGVSSAHRAPVHHLISWRRLRFPFKSRDSAERPTRLLTAAFLAVVTAGCRDSGTSARAGPTGLRGVASGCNVLLLTLDTTRADRIGCYGWKRAVTPALDALAQSGVRFDRAFCQAPITLPSHAVLLTGTYPPENGVRDNGRYALGRELPTLAESFRRHGYKTAAFIACQALDARHGLDRGFEVYDDEMPVSKSGESLYERRADQVCDKALEWLRRGRQEPFFCWVHLYDPHSPFAPPKPYLDMTGDPYDGEIAFMDAHIRRLVDWMRADSLLSKTLIVVVADHGESLGEHGYGFHALLVYDSIMRVPLMFSLPGRLPANVTHRGIVRVADVMPTILDLMGWDAPPQVSGESFIGALGGEAIPSRQSYGETDFPYENFGWSKLRCLIERRFKYIAAPEIELYDRVADHRELRNLARKHPDIVGSMRQSLAALQQRMHQRDGVLVGMDAETARALRSLGYVGSSPPPPTAVTKLKNPKDMVDVVRGFRRAEELLAERRAMEAINLLEPLVERSPESFVLAELLAKACATAGLREYAQRTAMNALSLHPQSADAHVLLAWVLGGRGALPQAVQACGEALGLAPGNEQARNLLHELKDALAREQAENAALARTLESTPDEVGAWFTLGTRLIRWGRLADGLGVLKDGLARNPEDPALASALAWHLATLPDSDLRDADEALRLARIACRGTLESNPNALDTLAAALAAVGRFDEAVETAQRAAKLAEQSGDQRLAAVIGRRLRAYRANQPTRWLP